MGTSGLEFYYDNILKGKKAVYKINDDNSLTLIKQEEKGQDLVLALDIELEKKSYELLQQNMERKKLLYIYITAENAKIVT